MNIIKPGTAGTLASVAVLLTWYDHRVLLPAPGLQLPDLALQVLQHPPDALQADDLPPLPGERQIRQAGATDPLHVVDMPGEESDVEVLPAPEVRAAETARAGPGVFPSRSAFTSPTLALVFVYIQ